MKQMKMMAIPLMLLGAQAAMAQQAGLKLGPIDVYGKVNVGVESISAKGATNPAHDSDDRIRVTDSYSYLGFKGSRDFNDDLSGFFQLEALVRVDNVANSNTNNNTSGGTSSNQLSSRNSGVGLRSKRLGELLIGRWDVYYTNHLPAGDMTFTRTGMNSTALALLGVGVSAWGGNAGSGTVDNGGRANNVVRYTTPNFKGLSGRITYVAGEAPNSSSNNNDAANDTGLELSLTYMTPMFFANLSNYRRDDAGNVIGNDSNATKIAGGVRIDTLRLGAVYETLGHKNASANVDRTRDAFAIFGAYGIGAWDFGATYAIAQKVKDKANNTDIDDSGAKFYQLTAAYALDKQTFVYATYAKITNEANARYDFFNQGAVGDTNSITANAIGPGSDPQSIMIGMSYFF